MIRFSIHRPIAVSMAYLAAALLGVAAWRNIPLEMLPDTELPRLTVTAEWRGSSPEVTEAFLTSPLEAAIQQVAGVEKITSTSMQQGGTGRSEISVEFARETDMNFARLDLLERFAAIEDDLPEEADAPRVSEYVPQEFAEVSRQFMSYTVTGPYTPDALRAHLDEVVVPVLLQVDGVAQVEAMGGRRRVLELRLDDAALAAHGLTPIRVQQALGTLEIVAEAGAVYDGGQLRTLAIRERPGSVDDVARAVVVADGRRIIRVSDVATVHDTWEDPRSYFRIDGHPAIGMMVFRQPRTNAVAVADSVKSALARLDGGHPPGVRFILDRDQSRDIRRQLTDLSARSTLSALVVFAVLLLFLGSFRSAVIVFATVAFSILLSLNFMYWAGYTLNVLTLMGLAMGFGIIADNAIVVLENIYRRWRAGEAVEAAAEHGSREVVLAIVAGTATTMVVFIPFVYLQGELRLYYVPLAVVVGLSQIASLLVSFSFIPALGARLLRAGDAARGAAALPKPPVYVRPYRSLLGFTLHHPWKTVFVGLVLIGGAYYLFDKHVTRGIVWGRWGGGGRSTVTVEIRQPRGEELARTDEVARFFEEKVRPLWYVERITTEVRPQSGRVTITFPDSVDATDIPVALQEELTGVGFGFGGTEVRVTGRGPAFYGGGSSPPNYSIQILGYNYETVRGIADGLAERLKRFSRIRDVDVNATSGFFDREKVTEIVLDIDRGRLAMHDMTMQDVVAQVRAAIYGTGTSGANRSIRIGGEERLVSVKLDGYENFDVMGLQELILPTRSGTGVRLGDIARIEERGTLSRILRENQQYQRTVAYEFRGPAKLGDRVRDAVVNTTEVPDGYTVIGRNEWKWDDDEARQLYGVLVISLVLVFMVCAALFESVRQPLCVLLTVPMALVGVFVLFYLVKASFTREAVIGVIMMGGIVVNNSILLVDRVNQLRREGHLSLHDALLEGTVQRVRPILMTSTSTVLGLLPLVLFSEYADENIWNALGYALIGGLTSSTLLVLTVTPAIYLLLERRGEHRRRAPEPVAAPTAEPGLGEPALAGAGD